MKCPACEKELTQEDLSYDGDDPPQEGDFNICLFCGAPLKWLKGCLELMSQKEYEEIKAFSPKIAALTLLHEKVRQKLLAAIDEDRKSREPIRH